MFLIYTRVGCNRSKVFIHKILRGAPHFRYGIQQRVNHKFRDRRRTGLAENQLGQYNRLSEETRIKDIGRTETAQMSRQLKLGEF